VQFNNSHIHRKEEDYKQPTNYILAKQVKKENIGREEEKILLGRFTQLPIFFHE
jgi:hypothetical protein